MSLAGLLLFASCAGAGDDPLQSARKKLYTNRGEAIAILERATQESPDRIDCWVELLRALEVEGESFVADCISRAALKRHPRSGELWQARAALFRGCAAWEAVRQLEKLPGCERQASDAKELLSLNLRVPFTWDQPFLYGHWGAALIVRQRWCERAQAHG